MDQKLVYQGRWRIRNGEFRDLYSGRMGSAYWHSLGHDLVRWTAHGGNGEIKADKGWKWEPDYDLMQQIEKGD